jgi:hypothetical protein
MEVDIKYINNIPTMDYEKFVKEKLEERAKVEINIVFDKWIAYPNEVLNTATIYRRGQDGSSIKRLGFAHTHLKDFECKITIDFQKCLYIKEWGKWVYEELKYLEGREDLQYNKELFKHVPKTSFTSERYKKDYNDYYELVMYEKIEQAKKECEDNLMM